MLCLEYACEISVARAEAPASPPVIDQYSREGRHSGKRIQEPLRSSFVSRVVCRRDQSHRTHPVSVNRIGVIRRRAIDANLDIYGDATHHADQLIALIRTLA
jgi:hypothetical protein